MNHVIPLLLQPGELETCPVKIFEQSRNN